jgi:membrane dipeptidase
VDDILRAKSDGRLAIVFDIEGGNTVDADIGLVEVYYRLGVRWMLLAYNFNNRLGGGCMDSDTGLTDFGRQVIDEMARVGMVLCCTHVGHRTAREAIEYSRNPVIFSHSNPAAVYPHVRNIPDSLLHDCARSGGVVNINGVGDFMGLTAEGEPDNSTATLVRHIDHVVQQIGAEHVGLGLDYIFDVAEVEQFIAAHPEKFPALKGSGYRQVEPERLHDIVDALIGLGYDDASIMGILGENNLRVARQVWRGP